MCRNYPHNLFGDDFMTFFDESVSTARDILSAGAQKASETIEIQKIKIDIARKKSSINAALKNLGKAYYDSRKNDCSAAGLCDSVVEDIDLKVAELAELEEKLADARKLKRCSKCGSRNRIDASFCNFCGARLDDDMFCSGDEAFEEDKKDAE